MKQTLIALTFALSLTAQAEDWTQFRGPRGNGVSADKNLPTTLKDSSLKWSVTLPGRGLSGA